MKRYNLYYTLNSNLPQEDLEISLKKSLVEFLNGCRESEAIIMLILEHHIQEGNVDVKNLSENLPYNLTITKGDSSKNYVDNRTVKNNDISFNLDDLPISLKWILHKFMGILSNN